MPVEDPEWPSDVQEPPGSPPEAATITIPRDPSPVTTPDDLDQVSHRDAGEDETAQDRDQEPLPEFDPRVHDDFDGLLYLGRLDHKFHAHGHKFVIRTLTTGEVLEIGLLHKPYADTLSDVKAYQAALLAACVVSVDDRPLPMPLTVAASDTGLRNRFEYVLDNWYPSVLDTVYQEYLILEDKVRQVMEAMGKASR